MTASDLLTTEELQREPVKERLCWHNRFWLSASQRVGDGRSHIGPGLYRAGAFASKQEAEVRAERWLTQIHSGLYIIEATIIYLGAFAENDNNT